MQKHKGRRNLFLCFQSIQSVLRKIRSQRDSTRDGQDEKRREKDRRVRVAARERNER